MASLAINAAPDAGILTGAELIPVLKNGSPAHTTTSAITGLGGAFSSYDPGIPGYSGPFGTVQDALRVTLYATQLGMAGDDATDNSGNFAQALAMLKSMGGGKFIFDYDRRQTATCVYRLGSPHRISTNVEIEGQNGVAIRINHNTGVGLDFARVPADPDAIPPIPVSPRTEHQILRNLKIYDGGTRNGLYKLIRFQQAARFLIADCFFDSTRDSLDWLETESGHIVNTVFWECEGVDWSLGNSIDVWIYATQHLGKQDPTPDPGPGNPYVPYTPIQLGNGVEITNGVSGLKAFGWAIGRKHRGLYFGTRTGALTAPAWVSGTDYSINSYVLTDLGFYRCTTDPGPVPSTVQPSHDTDTIPVEEHILADGYGWTNFPVAGSKTPEHVDCFGLVVDNCRDVGVEIDDLFNANFYGYFISFCGLIDATLGDPNGERRVGILMSAGPHPSALTQTSTQKVVFHRGGWVALNRHEGMVIQGTAASGRTMTPTNIGIHGQFGSNNRADIAGNGHILVDGGDVNGLNFDGAVFKTDNLKIPIAPPNSDHCIKFNGDLANQDIRLTNMTLGDTFTLPRIVGDISLNNGVVIAGNNELFFTTWTPALFFGGSAASVAGTFVGRKRAANGLMTLEFEVTLTDNGSGTGAATITGMPQPSLGDAIGDLKILSGGNTIPSGIHCRINGATLYLEYQGATGSTALTDTHLTNTVNFVGSISYAMGRP